MKEIDFIKAKKIYSFFSSRREKKQKKSKNYLENKKYLILSNLYDRDIFSSDECLNQTLFVIGLKGYKLNKELTSTLTTDNILTINIGRIFNKKSKNKFKFLFNCISKNIFKKIFIHLIKILVSLIDAFFILFFSLLFILFNPIFFKNKHKKSYKEIYSITYFKSKREKSINYYYKDFYIRNSKIALITNFHEYKFIFNGLFNSSLENYMIHPLYLLNIKDIIKSIFSLLILYFWDFKSLRDIKYGKIIAFFNSLKFINRKLFYLFSFYASEKLIKLDPEYIFLWTENQLHSKSISFPLGFYIKDKKLSKLKLINYIGYPYFNNYYPHLTPSEFELEMNIWGANKFIFNNLDSLEEFKYSLKDKKFENLELKLCRKKMKRSIVPNNKNIYPKEYSNKRDLTLFSHASSIELINMIRFIRASNFLKVKFNKKIYIRLHPSLSETEVIRIIRKLRIINIDNYIFINKNNESLDESFQLTSNCLFSDSNLINTALTYDLNILVIKSNFLYDPPVYLKNKSNKRIKFL